MPDCFAPSPADLPAPIASIQSRLERAVRAEQESELRALRALYAAGSLRRLQREGVVLVGLAAEQGGRLFRSTLWRFELLRPTGRSGPAQPGQGQQQLPHHKFKAGVSVLITRHVPEGGGGGGAKKDGGGGGDVAVAVDEEAGAMPMDGVEGVVTEVSCYLTMLVKKMHIVYFLSRCFSSCTSKDCTGHVTLGLEVNSGWVSQTRQVSDLVALAVLLLLLITTRRSTKTTS